jgi:hypothetical protein
MGFLKDVEKYNHATTQGWRILRVFPQTLATRETVAMIKECLT